MILHVLIMASFYLTVNSDGSLDTHPNNYGGNFKMELYEEMYLPGMWEMAVVEMSYFGQHFPNLPSHYNTIEVSNIVQDAYQTEFVIRYHEADDFYLTLESTHLVSADIGDNEGWKLPTK